MNTVYIDVDNGVVSGYKYDWSLGSKAAEVIRLQEGIDGTVKFVCNSLAKISEGDAYAVTFNKAEDLTYFVLKGKFDLISAEKAEEYITTHDRQRKYTIGDNT